MKDELLSSGKLIPLDKNFIWPNIEDWKMVLLSNKVCLKYMKICAIAVDLKNLNKCYVSFGEKCC